MHRRGKAQEEGGTCMARRSELSDCPIKIASGGKISIKAFWTSSRVVVTPSNISAVMPENLESIKI